MQAENLILRLASLNHCKVVGKVSDTGWTSGFFFSVPYSGKGFFVLISHFPSRLFKPASLQIGVYRDYWSGLKRPEGEADSSPPCHAELFRMSVPIPSILLRLYGMYRPIYLHPFVIMAKISCLSLKISVSSPLYALNNFIMCCRKLAIYIASSRFYVSFRKFCYIIEMD